MICRRGFRSCLSRWWWILLPVVVGVVAGCGGPKRTPPLVTDSSAPAPVRPPVRRAPGAPVLIRVGLATGESQAELTTTGVVLLLTGDGRRQVARLTGPASLSLVSGADGLHWRSGFRSGEASLLFVHSLDPANLLSWQGRTYRGEILVLAAAEGLTLVNVVELEEYLRGVVPWEIGRPGPEASAAVEAQAVAARTYTISHLGERSDLGFDVWADVRDQVYKGARDEDEVGNRAIERTVGLVLRAGSEEITAYYCSTCGGRTSNVAEVWPRPGAPYLRSHEDRIGGGEPFCAGSRHYRWEVTWSAAELERILTRTLPEYLTYVAAAPRAAWAGKPFTLPGRGGGTNRLGRLLGLEIVQRTTSGRVARLDVATDAGTYHVRGDRVRWVLQLPGPDAGILKSAWFDLEVTTTDNGRLQSVTARGRGFGHGVGMCQTGALAMARSGYSCAQILAHYYPGARLEPLEPR